jgi:hypothetical protein
VADRELVELIAKNPEYSQYLLALAGVGEKVVLEENIDKPATGKQLHCINVNGIWVKTLTRGVARDIIRLVKSNDMEHARHILHNFWIGG